MPPFLILILVEQEIFFRGIVWPNFLNTFVDITFIFYLLKVLQHLKGCTGADGIIYQFVLGCWPGRIF